MFKNKNGELRAGWKIAGMLGAVFGSLFLLIFGTPLAYQIAAVINTSMMFIQTLVMIGIPILLWRKGLKKDLRSLGLPALTKHWRSMGLGLAIGAGSMTLVFLLLLFTDSAQVLTWTPQWNFSFLVMLAMYILVGYSEEIVCRGYIQGVMKQTHNPILIVLVPSILFSLMHSAKSGMGLIPYLNLFLIGLYLSLITLSSGSLYPAIGYHIFWNFFQGPVYGFSVSGGMESGLLSTYMKGNSLLNGGAFGPEGGLIVTAVILLMLGVWYWKNQAQLPVLWKQLKSENVETASEE